jgi:hypothetical protein
MVHHYLELIDHNARALYLLTNLLPSFFIISVYSNILNSSKSHQETAIVDPSCRGILLQDKGAFVMSVPFISLLGYRLIQSVH